MQNSAERLYRINQCLSRLGTDYDSNIEELTALCGQLLEATSALYNRFESGMMISQGQWNTPQDYVAQDDAEGHICYHILQQGAYNAQVLVNLQQSSFLETDPDVFRYGLETYIGHPVLCGQEQVGVICAVYNTQVEITEDDKQVLGIIASAIGREEERKQAEQSLARNEKEFRLIFQENNDAILWADQEGYILRCNRAAETLFGYTREELLGMHQADLHPEEKRDYYKDMFQNKLQAQGFAQAEAEVVVQSGERRYVNILATTVVINGEEINQGIFVDVTESKRNREQMERFRAAMNSAVDELYIIDPEQMRFVDVNQAACSSLGYSREELLEMGPQDIKPLFSAMELKKVLYEVIQGRETQILETMHCSSEGTEFPVEIRVSAFTQESRDFIIALARDVSERKRQEEALEEARKQAESANQAKSQFLANMSHEIRTPLTGVLGMADLLLDTELTRNQQDYVQSIKSSGEIQLALINDILDFSKIEAGKLELETIDFNLRHLLEDMTFPLAIRAHEKNLEFICYIEPDIPELLRGDPVRLRQILNNLAGNALKFTEAGEIEVRVSLLHKSELEAKILFTVRDTGPGIPQHKQASLFDKFSQLDSSFSRQQGGTGLGLAISKHLVELMGGEIGVDSTEGKGTSFWFTLQFSRQEEKEQPLPESMWELRDKKVLVVENNTTNREIIVQHLLTWGAQPVETQDGKTGLNILYEALEQGEPVDLVITELDLPVMDGESLCRAIKRDENINDVPLIVITAIGYPGEAKRCGEMGFDAYLNKPVRKSELLDTLNAVLCESCKPQESRSLVTRHMAREKKRSQEEALTFSGHVLVAEDNPVNQKVVVRMLEKKGLSAEVVSDGQMAREALENKDFDLVLMDVQMPRMDGLEATRRIRAAEREGDVARERLSEEATERSESLDSRVPESLYTTIPESRNSRIPIIALTAHALKEDREKCFQAGMDDYLSKPFQHSALEGVLRKYLPSFSNQAVEHQESLSATEKEESTPETAVFQESNLLSRVSGDQEIFQEIIKESLQEIPARHQDLRNSLNSKDAQAVHRYAHSIKGVARNISAPGLEDVASRLEEMANKGNLSGCSELMPNLEQESQRLLAVLRERVE